MADSLEEKFKEALKDVLITGVVVGATSGVTYTVYRIIKHFTGGGAAAKTTTPPIDLTFADNALKDLSTELKLDPNAPGDEGKENRHRAFFLYRRVRDLGIADEKSRTGQGLENAKRQAKQELDQVNKFLEEKLGSGSTSRGPYSGGGESGLFDPHHLDLGNFVSVLVSDPPPTTERDAVAATSPTVNQAQTLRELEQRKMRVTGIVLRAAALYPALWKGTGTDSKLQTIDLTEILDRRLRTVERLHYEASAGASPEGIGSSFIRGDGELFATTDSSDAIGWFDKIKHRMFEAPSMPIDISFIPQLLVQRQKVDATGTPVKDAQGNPEMETLIFQTLQETIIKLKLLLNDPGAARFNTAMWYLNRLTNEFDWNILPGTRMKPSMLTHVVDPKKPPVPFPLEWERVADTGAGQGYGWIMKPRRIATAVIKELFVTGSLDLWNRSWLHSDGVLSALHIEALYFGLRRRKTRELHEKKSEDERKKAEQDIANLDAQERQLQQQFDEAMQRQAPADVTADLATKLTDVATKKSAIRGKDDELDQAFNALATPDQSKLALDDYFEVRHGIVRAPDAIMKTGNTDHFENSAVPFDDLQIGDQVLFESSPVLKALGATNWDYPTVLVTEIDSFPPGVNVDPSKLTIQGFNSVELGQPSFQLLLAKTVDAYLDGVRNHIETQIRRIKAQSPPVEPPETIFWDPGIITQNDFLNNDRGTLRLWNPYGDQWDDPGPWWIWINLNAPIWGGTFSGDVAKTLGQTHGGIVWLGDKLLPEFLGRAELASTLPIGSGFQAPPFEDHPDSDEHSAVAERVIFVPLYEPEGGWISYFNTKARDPKGRLGPTLNPVVSDSSWLPGLAKAADKIRVIRPQLKP